MNSMIVTMTQPIVEMNLMERGLYFGYPICCVLEFCHKYQMGSHVGVPDSKFTGTGYVPCAACAEQPVEDVLAYIKKHRHAPTPFQMYTPTS